MICFRASYVIWASDCSCYCIYGLLGNEWLPLVRVYANR